MLVGVRAGPRGSLRRCRPGRCPWRRSTSFYHRAAGDGRRSNLLVPTEAVDRPGAPATDALPGSPPGAYLFSHDDLWLAQASVHAVQGGGHRFTWILDLDRG